MVYVYVFMCVCVRVCVCVCVCVCVRVCVLGVLIRAEERGGGFEIFSKNIAAGDAYSAYSRRKSRWLENDSRRTLSYFDEILLFSPL